MDTFKLMQITATQMFACHSVNLFQFNNPSKNEAFNNRVVCSKNFKAMASLV